MTCSSDGSLRVWNSKTGVQIGDDWRDGESGVNAIALSPDGKRIASGNEDGTVRLWNIDTGKVITKWSGHKSGIAYLCWNRDGGRVVSGSWDGTTRVRDVKSRETILAIKTGLDNVRAVVYSPDSTMFATGGHSEEKEFIKIWDANTGKLIANVTGHTSTVTCLAWTADGRRLISGSCDRSIRTWNTSTWQQITILAEQTHTVSAIAISPNDRILASASWDDTTRLWNLGDGQSIGSPLQHANFVFCVSFSADSKLLATGCWDDNAYAWDISAVIREVGLGLDELLLNPNVSLIISYPYQTAERAIPGR
jgi:WD40 repeat protein